MGYRQESSRLKHQLWWLIGLSALLIIYSWVSFFRLLGQTNFVDHTYRYDAQLRTTFFAISQAETSFRRYQLTHNSIALDQYKQSVAEVPRNISMLRAETITPSGLVWFYDTKPKVDELLAFMASAQQIDGKSTDTLDAQKTSELGAELNGLFGARRNQVMSDLHERIRDQNTETALHVAAVMLVNVLVVLLCLLLFRSTKKALEAAKLKSEFVANLSHEMRTPMYAILASSELLTEETEPSEIRLLSKNIHTSANALMAEMNDIIDFVKLEAGSITVYEQNFAPAAIVAQVQQQLSAEASAKSLTLESSIHSNVPKRLYGDQQKIQRVLINLVSNAIKFTDHGRVRISVSARRHEKNIELHVAVVDTGIGVPPERRDAVTMPFVQGDGSNTRRHGGLGLGLTIADRFVKLMDGRSGFITKPGRGSAFWFEVPTRVA